MSSLSAAWAYARKDLMLFFRDRTALLLSLALPLVLSMIFGGAMAGMSGDEAIGRVRIYVEDLDASERSRKLVAELQSAPGLEVRLETNVRERISKGKAPAALLVPSGYGGDLDAGRTPKLVLYRDPGQAIEQQIVAGNLMPALLRTSGREVGRGLMKRGMQAFGVPAAAVEQAERMFGPTFELIDELPRAEAAREGASANGFDFAKVVPELLGIEIEDVVGEAKDASKIAGQAHAVSGIAVMMLLFGVASVGATLLEERAAGTLQRLQLAPIPGVAILWGKLIYSLVAGAVQLVVLFAFGALVFHLPIGRSPVALVVLCVAVVFAATGLGLLLAIACASRKQLEGLSTLIILAMSALGGSWFPLVVTPSWFQTAGHFTLNAWAMDGFQGILWYGKDLSGIALEVGVLFAIGAVLTFLAWRGWKARYELAP